VAMPYVKMKKSATRLINMWSRPVHKLDQQAAKSQELSLLSVHIVRTQCRSLTEFSFSFTAILTYPTSDNQQPTSSTCYYYYQVPILSSFLN